MGSGDQFARQQSRAIDVCFGSKADVTLLNFDVRFTPESGHSPTRSGCLLWAKSRLMHRSKLLRYSTTSDDRLGSTSDEMWCLRQVRLAPGNGPIAYIEPSPFGCQVRSGAQGDLISLQTRPCAELAALCRLSRRMVEQILRPSPKGGTCVCFSSASAASR